MAAAKALAGNPWLANYQIDINLQAERRKRAAVQAFRSWEQVYFRFLVRLRDSILARAAADGLDIEDPWLSGVHLLAKLDFDLETLVTGSDEEKLQLQRDWRGGHGH